MDLPPIRNRVVAASLAFLVVGLAACGGGGKGDAEPPPPSGSSAAASRAAALSSQAASTGSLATDEGFAAGLVRALQAQWTPAVRDAAMVYSTWPFVQGPFYAVDWRSVPPEQPPAEYGAVLASGAQVVARAYRCERAFDPVYAGGPSAVFAPVPALDALTAAQRSALSLDQFTTNLLLAVSANRLAVRGVFQRPGQASVGDSTLLVMEQCDNRRHGAGLPPDGELSVTTGRVEATLVGMASADDQLVSNTFSLTTTSADARATSKMGTFFGHFSRGVLVSLVRDDVRISNLFFARVSQADPVVRQVELLVPVPGANATGSVPAPTLNIKYDEWTLDWTTGLAVDGTVTITDSGRNSATIKPVGASYEVKIKSGSQERTYTVAP